MNSTFKEIPFTLNFDLWFWKQFVFYYIQLRKPRGRISDLLSPEMRRTTLILWVLWYVNKLYL